MRSLPNAISIVRALCAIPVVLLVTPATAIGALALFVGAAATDAVDGALARRLRVETSTGALLDPLADKVLILGTLGGLVGLGAADPVAFALILTRESFVTAARAVAAFHGSVIAASKYGKTKATLQGAAVVVLLGAVAWPELGVRQLADAVLWLASIATLITGVDVIRRVGVAIIPAHAR